MKASRGFRAAVSESLGDMLPEAVHLVISRTGTQGRESGSECKLSPGFDVITRQKVEPKKQLPSKCLHTVDSPDLSFLTEQANQALQPRRLTAQVHLLKGTTLRSHQQPPRV